ncbi:MAG TPA: redoxin domain-containing protein, partial [Alphaproteobacteria bacterium]|nr:redoxin domain-containing protein [Alphaproteobacteria bacterium]
MQKNKFNLVLAFIAMAFMLLAFSAPSMATGTVKVGDTIPHDLDFKDQNGKMHTFKDLTGKKGMVLVFIRSVEWCPFCQKQVIELNKERQKFLDKGYSVVTVSYDTVEHMKKFVTTNNPKITLLSDPGSKSIRAFGILNEASAKGTMSYGIPHPGVYVVSKDKKVQAEIFKDGYQDRATIKEILAAIDKANPPPVPSLDDMGSDPIIPGEDVIDIPEKITDPVVVPEEGEPTMQEDGNAVPAMPETTPVPATDPMPVEEGNMIAPEMPQSGMPEAAPEAVQEMVPETAPEIAPDMPVEDEFGAPEQAAPPAL